MYTDFCGWYPYYWCDYPTPNQVMGIPVSGGLQTTLQTQIDRQMFNCCQEIGSSVAIDKVDVFTDPEIDMLNHYYYANNLPVYELERCPKTTKVDIFETLNLLIFPYDPIRDWTKKKVTEINERFKPLEKALGI